MVLLWSLSYISTATEPAAIIEPSVREICALAGRHNAREGITGALTFHLGRFAQLIEGPESALRALMVRILADPRHHSLRVITAGPIAVRRYADWSMAYRDPSDFICEQIDERVPDPELMVEALMSTWH
jgi:hypothetical protein